MAPLRVRAIAFGASPPATRRMYFTVISGSAVSDSVTPSTAEGEVEVEIEVEARSLLSGEVEQSPRKGDLFFLFLR